MQATSTWWGCRKSCSSAWQWRMTLQLNCRNLPLSKAGPGAAVLVWAGGLLGPMERECWERESPDEKVERVRSKSVDSDSLVGAAGGTGVEHVAPLVTHHALKGNPIPALMRRLKKWRRRLTERRSGHSFLGWKKSVTEENEVEDRLKGEAHGRQGCETGSEGRGLCTRVGHHRGEKVRWVNRFKVRWVRWGVASEVSLQLWWRHLANLGVGSSHHEEAASFASEGGMDEGWSKSSAK